MEALVQRRASERIAADIGVRFACGSLFYAGTITDMSEKGMFIRTNICLPQGSLFIAIILADKKMLQVFARVKRTSRGNGNCDGMGVEITNPSFNYLQYISKLQSS